MSNHIPRLEASYQATVSTGLENIACDEIKEKFGVSSTTQQGRVSFSSDAPLEELLKLKSICNLFVIIYETTLKANELPQSEACLEPLLTEVGDKSDWKTGLDKWRQVKNFPSSVYRLMTKDEQLRNEQPKFRVSCNRFGKTHKFTSPDVCSVFGHVLDTKFGWPIKMKGFDLEVIVNFNENYISVGLTLTPIALDRRSIVAPGYTTLRAATCYALLRIAKIQCGDIVLDPMAGSGAIPVECNSAWKEEWFAFTLAGELGDKILESCKINLNSSSNHSPIDIMQLDVTSLPLKTDSIDVLVSDLPFGRRHGSKQTNKTLYPALLREMGRIARVNEARAVLLTQDATSMRIAYDKNRDIWVQKLCQFIKVGNLNCYIYLFIRNHTKYEVDDNKTTCTI